MRLEEQEGKKKTRKKDALAARVLHCRQPLLFSFPAVMDFFYSWTILSPVVGFNGSLLVSCCIEERRLWCRRALGQQSLFDLLSLGASLRHSMPSYTLNRCICICVFIYYTVDSSMCIYSVGTRYTYGTSNHHRLL